jgi:hypothetical protein
MGFLTGECPRWTRVGLRGEECGACGGRAAVLLEGQHRCWPCLAEGLARDLVALRAERGRLLGLVEAHEGVLRALDEAVAQVQAQRRSAAPAAPVGPEGVPAWLVRRR